MPAPEQLAPFGSAASAARLLVRLQGDDGARLRLDWRDRVVLGLELGHMPIVERRYNIL